MKYIIVILFEILALLSCTNKTEKSKTEISSTETSKNFSDTTNEQINKEIEKEAFFFEKKLDKEYLTSEQVKFTIDTFKINLKNHKRQDFDYSTEGMNNSVIEMRDEYEKLLNKYYTKLLQKLDSSDRVKLINSQKNWLKYRKSEEEFIQIMLYTKYNSGGTIQSNFAIGNYFNLVESRTIQIFSHYNSIIEKEELEKE